MSFDGSGNTHGGIEQYSSEQVFELNDYEVHVGLYSARVDINVCGGLMYGRSKCLGCFKIYTKKQGVFFGNLVEVDGPLIDCDWSYPSMVYGPNGSALVEYEIVRTKLHINFICKCFDDYSDNKKLDILLIIGGSIGVIIFPISLTAGLVSCYCRHKKMKSFMKNKENAAIMPVIGQQNIVAVNGSVYSQPIPNNSVIPQPVQMQHVVITQPEQILQQKEVHKAYVPQPV